jgi:hypothetical protein
MAVWKESWLFASTWKGKALSFDEALNLFVDGFINNEQ